MFSNMKVKDSCCINKLPNEVLYIIFDYLPPRTLFYVVRAVCKRFYELLNNDGYFLIRFKKRYNFEFPLVDAYGLTKDTPGDPSGTGLSWRDMCVRMDTRFYLWSRHRDPLHKVFGTPHTSSIDTLKLLNNGQILATGGRDKLLCLWSMANIIESEEISPVGVKNKPHEGWLWNMASFQDDQFLSCGFDLSVKLWNINPFTETRSFSTDWPVMSLASEHSIIAAGLQSGYVSIFDSRENQSQAIWTSKIHRGTVTGIQMWQNNIVTIGEDNYMSISDFRNQRQPLFRPVNSHHRSCPRSINIYRNVCCIGDSKGYLNIYSLASDYKPIMCVRIGGCRGINAIVSGPEGLVLGTSDIGLRLVVPSIPNLIVNEMDCNGEVVSLDMMKNVIVAGSSNSTKCLHLFMSYDDENYESF